MEGSGVAGTRDGGVGTAVAFPVETGASGVMHQPQRWPPKAEMETRYLALIFLACSRFPHWLPSSTPSQKPADTGEGESFFRLGS